MLFDLRLIEALYIKRQNQVKEFAIVISSFPVNFRLGYCRAEQVINYQIPMSVYPLKFTYNVKDGTEFSTFINYKRIILFYS